MIRPSAIAASQETEPATIWGLEPPQVHDRFWAARGVQVVRQGEPSEIVDDAELFLLTGPQVLTIFKLRQVIETLSWLKPVLLYIRIHDDHEQEYRERVVTEADGRFVRFERLYRTNSTNMTRVALTSHREIALAWQTSASPSQAWRLLRQSLSRDQWTTRSITGHLFNGADAHDLNRYIRTLVRSWPHPDATITRLRKVGSQAWCDVDAHVDSQARLIGPVWVGAGRRLNSQTPAIGPVVLWDDPAARPTSEAVRWDAIEPSKALTRPVTPREQSVTSRRAKRLFDIAFALTALIITLPIYPLVMLAIFLENGRPFFFTHRRETLDGREFECIKFRSMRRDAEAVKAQLAQGNQADGPQFFLEDDPRLTRVGRFIRRANIDELPQFINVLLGHMSIVGPRPSPFEENQFCPAWRDARLSVRPGVTGLWQIKRSRFEGMDFQEWIKYDIEYVERMSWRLDLWIIWRTIPIVLRGVLR